MNNTPELDPRLPAATETEAALKRLLTSERFRKNASLRQMLEYLVLRTLAGEQNQIKEATVAIDVFGRPGDFDNRIDNIVRVQAHRLRKLLTSYYEMEGAAEHIRFSIPRGGYIPHIEESKASSAEVDSSPAPIDTSISGLERLPPHPQTIRRAFAMPAVIGAFTAGVLTTLSALLLFRLARPEVRRAAGSESARSEPLAAVWNPLLQPGVDCVVAYTNPVFLATGTAPAPRILIPYSGLLSAPAGARINISTTDLNLGDGFATDSTFNFSDGWTGVGEVAAMQRVTSLLSPEVALHVIRSRTLTYADIRNSNVIFLGSPWANDMQKKINIGITPLVNDNSGNILNLEPRSGEPASYRAHVDAATQQITNTYGLFSVLPGLSSQTRVFISAGVNTYGTAAAIEFMTTSAGVREVMQRLGTASRPKSLPDYFQVVVRAEMIRGEPAETQLVLTRALRSKM